MENENLNERESLRLISDMIERAKRTEIGRLNFVTLYGILGLAVYIGNIGLGCIYRYIDNARPRL